MKQSLISIKGSAEKSKHLVSIQAVRTLDAFSGLAILLFCWFVIKMEGWQISVALMMAVLSLILVLFLHHIGEGHKAKRRSVLWIAVFLLASHLTLGYHDGVWQVARVDDSIGWVLKENLNNASLEGPAGTRYIVTTDDRGYRNHNKWPTDGEVLPVILQGDSNAFGFGLQEAETFCRVWEKRSGRAEHCFNIGVPGYDLQHYYFQYRKFEDKYQIGKRIILFNVGNDFTASALDSPYLIRRPYLYIENDKTESYAPEPAKFQKQVYGYYFIKPYERFSDQMNLVSMGHDWGRYMPGWFAEFRLGAFLFGMIYPRVFRIYVLTVLSREEQEHGKALNPYYPSWQLLDMTAWPEPYKDYTHHFSALVKKISRQRAEDTVLILIPMREQVLTNELDSAVANHPKFQANAMNSYVTGIAHELGIRVIDATPHFLNHPTPHRLFQADHHVSAEGISLIVGLALSSSKMDAPTSKQNSKNKVNIPGSLHWQYSLQLEAR